MTIIPTNQHHTAPFLCCSVGPRIPLLSSLLHLMPGESTHNNSWEGTPTTSLGSTVHTIPGDDGRGRALYNTLRSPGGLANPTLLRGTGGS